MLIKGKQADRDYYADLLFSDRIKFYGLVLQVNEERNANKKYVG